MLQIYSLHWLCCSYLLQVILFTDQLHNSIIEGIREDCEGCGFQEKHLKEEIISCQPREHSVYYRAKIYNWESLYYPVPVILGRIRARYGNNTNTLIMPTIDFSNGSFDSEDDLELIATNVSTNYTIIRSEISSGEGEVTTKEDTLMTLSTVTLSDAFGADARPRGLPMSALCSLAVGVLTLHKLLLHWTINFTHCTLSWPSSSSL